MKIGQYQLLTDFNSPEIGAVGQQRFRMYKAGDFVNGYVYVEADSATALPPQLVVDDLYMIPLVRVKKTADLTDELGNKMTIVNPSDETRDQNKEPQYSPSMEDEFEKIRNTSVVRDVINKSKSSVNGMVMGAGAGLIISALTKRSIFLGIVIGSVVGGIIGSKININLSDIKKANEPGT